MSKNIQMHCPRCSRSRVHKWDWVPVNQVYTKCLTCFKVQTFQPSVELSRRFMEAV